MSFIPMITARRGNLGRAPITRWHKDMETKGRSHVIYSDDHGKTWKPEQGTDYAIYSNLAVLSDGSIACLYERGAQQPYERITFARFTLDWLTDGLDRLTDGKDTLALP